MDEIKTDNQETKVNKLTNWFQNTWIGVIIFVFLLIMGGLNLFHDFFSNFFVNASKEKIEIQQSSFNQQIVKLHFEENGELIKGIEILSPNYLRNIQENNEGEFNLEDTLSDRTIIKYRKKSDLIIKTLPIYREGNNYVVYIE
jgi:hypothetical protein